MDFLYKPFWTFYKFNYLINPIHSDDNTVSVAQEKLFQDDIRRVSQSACFVQILRSFSPPNHSRRQNIDDLYSCRQSQFNIKRNYYAILMKLSDLFTLRSCWPVFCVLTIWAPVL